MGYFVDAAHHGKGIGKPPGGFPGGGYPKMINEAMMAASMPMRATIWAAVCAGVVNLIPLYAFIV